MIRLITFFAIFVHLNSFAILVSPIRIDLGNNQSMQILHVTNAGDEVVHYTIEYVYQKMQKDGTYTVANEKQTKDMHDIQKFVIIDSTAFTLKPHQIKKITIKLNKNLPILKNEYNAHILFKQVLKKEKHTQNISNQSFVIQPKSLLHLAIPIFVYKNTPHFQAKITNIKYNRSRKQIKFDITNTGKFSPYGDLIVKLFKGNKLRHREVLKNISITKPLELRTINMNIETNVDLNKANLIEVTYQTPNENNAGVIICQESVKI